MKHRRGFRGWIGAALVIALSGAIPGCIRLAIDHGALPGGDRLSRLEPGRTTFDEVIAWLGPPDELRRPAAGDRGRALDVRVLRSDEEHQIFDRRRISYSVERRRQRSLNAVVFVISWVDESQARLVLFFDDKGVLTDAIREEG